MKISGKDKPEQRLSGFEPLCRLFISDKAEQVSETCQVGFVVPAAWRLSGNRIEISPPTC